MDSMVQAVELIMAYETNRDRPNGSYDSRGRWYPSDTEKCSCCNQIRWPSARYPYSLLKHCYSLKHIAVKLGVDQKELRRAVKENRPSYEAVDILLNGTK